MKFESLAFLVGGVALVLVLALTVLAPWVAPYVPTDQHVLDRLKPPSGRFLLGTDQYGRDLLSRTLVGGRAALVLGVGAVLLGLSLGVPIGLTAGYFGGRLDDVVMRLVDAMLAFPALLLALLAIGVANVPGIARIVRSVTLSLREAEFVLAAGARGEGHLYVMFGEIFPNVLPSVVVEATIRIGFAILAGASLSFLGLGVQPPQADWGVMIREARQYAFESSWPMVAPGVALGVTIIAFNLFGDGLRDRLGAA